MLTEIDKALKCGTILMDTDEAYLLCMHENFFDNHTGQDVKKGQWLAIEKAWGYDIFGAITYRSTKGSYKRCDKAFEKYSPKYVKEILEQPRSF